MNGKTDYGFVVDTVVQKREVSFALIQILTLVGEADGASAESAWRRLASEGLKLEDARGRERV